MATRTSPYGFLVGVTDEDSLPAEDWILLAQSSNDVFACLADLFGAGVWTAGDFEVTSAGGLEVTVAGGTAFVGGAGARALVRLASSQTFTGLTGETTYGIYVKPDGTRAAVEAGDSAPAGALLVRTFATTGGAVTGIAAPAGLAVLGDLLKPRKIYEATDDIPAFAIGEFALVTWAHGQGYACVLDARCKVQTAGGAGYAYADAPGFRVTRLDQREDTGRERDGNTEVWLIENISYAGGAASLHLAMKVQGV